VALITMIVTGDMERRGLASSLKKVFHQADFSIQKVDSFTSTKVLWPPPKARGVQSAIEKYATAFLAALDPGRREPRPDYVFGIDDLELENRTRPDAVIHAFRCAVAAEMENRRSTMNARSCDKFAARVKDNCSFHLFVPMLEAYFYADPVALRSIGCVRNPVLDPCCDVEQFQTTDPDYLTPSPQPSLPWAIDLGSRPFHPKRYLQFLLEPTLYSETDQGVRGLSGISWRSVLGRSDQTLFLRSLFQDLAHAVGLEVSSFPGSTHPLTSAHSNPNRILRNC
jgi:hypothetical protein